MDDRRFSPSSLIVGLGGLAVAIWALLGSPDIPDSSALRWGAIGVAIIVGIALIIGGGLTNRGR